jgi:hypothetical protein
LTSLTSRTGGQYVYVTDAATLTALYQQTSTTFQSEYAVTYVSPFPLRDGVNRNLTVSLTTGVVPAVESKYNPGGVLPEVTTGRSWTLFFAILLGLLALLVLPLLISFGANALAGMRKKGGGQSVSTGRTPQPARGRIKFK